MSPEAQLLEQYHDASNLEARIRLHEQFSTNTLGLHPWLLSQMDLPIDADVLDLGCGVGSFWVTNRDRIPPGWRIALTDVSPGMVREAHRRLSAYPNAFTFATASAGDIPYPDAKFDAVCAHFMLYHVDDRPQAIREIARVLRPGGQFHAATNGARHMQEARRLAMRAELMTSADVAAGDAVAFSLENGAAQLQREFPGIELRRYRDSLIVTAEEPLLAYILSSAQIQQTLSSLEAADQEHRLKTLRALFHEHLAAEGQINVTKDAGLFIARRR